MLMVILTSLKCFKCIKCSRIFKRKKRKKFSQIEAQLITTQIWSTTLPTLEMNFTVEVLRKEGKNHFNRRRRKQVQKCSRKTCRGKCFSRVPKSLTPMLILLTPRALSTGLKPISSRGRVSRILKIIF